MRARDRIGPYGARPPSLAVTPDLAVTVESLGFGAIWVGRTRADLVAIERLLDATTTLVVAASVVNIWESDGATVARSYHRLAERHPGRFLVGIGSGHRETNGAVAARSVSAIDAYLDVLLENGVDRDDIVLAALGPKMLRLAARRTAGAHPYLVTPAHTAHARALMGEGPLLAPEQRLVLAADVARARAIGRPEVAHPYLGFTNYRRSLERLGYTPEDLAGSGSDRLVDDLVVSGTDATIRSRLAEHLAAGADHVAVQVLGPPEDVQDAYRHVAQLLELG